MKEYEGGIGFEVEEMISLGLLTQFSNLMPDYTTVLFGNHQGGLITDFTADQRIFFSIDIHAKNMQEFKQGIIFGKLNELIFQDDTKIIYQHTVKGSLTDKIIKLRIDDPLFFYEYKAINRTANEKLYDGFVSKLIKGNNEIIPKVPYQILDVHNTRINSK